MTLSPKEIDNIFREAEKTYTFKLRRGLFKDLIMAGFEPMGDKEIDSEDLKGLIEDNINKAVAFMKENQNTNANNPAISQSKTNTRRRAYAFERRLYLVNFVLTESRSLDLDFIISKTFSSSRRRIDWTQICTAWNKLHPPMRPDTMKGDFYHYIKENELESEFFSRKEREFRVSFAPVFKDLGQRIELFREVINQYFPRVNSIHDLINELKKSHKFQGLDVESLTPREVTQILERRENEKAKGGKSK